MEVVMHLLVSILLLASPLYAQVPELCSYMTAIPRELRPDDIPVVDENVPWSERPLFPAMPEREEVCMDVYRPAIPTMGSQVIYMDEEQIGDVVIAKLNYNGATEPHIDRNFVSGSFALLGPAMRRSEGDGYWYLVITQRQDYESPGMQLYVFNVQVEGQALVVMTSVEIVNIDDNRPMINVFEPCQAAEHGEPGLTTCVYEVTDLDGEISTRQMTFEISSDRGDQNIFYLVGNTLPTTWFTMHMTVGMSATLNFEETPLHIFSVTAYDSVRNEHTVPLMVQVQNVESRPPRWVEIFAVQQFDEKTEQDFTVRAIDGDTEINRTIEYRIERAEEDTFFHIEGATLYVDPIDRDALEREVFQLSIIAFKRDDEGNEAYSTETPIVIIVNDVNDCSPDPFHNEYHIEIDEETPMTLNLEDFGFHDRDLGQNAQYTVHLESVQPPGAHNAFYIAPQVGYQRQEFIVGTTDHHMLDFEVPEFQNIILRVVAIDLNMTQNRNETYLHINLLNWNDELPIFERDTLTVEFDETEGENFFVGNMRANDRDIGDRVIHSILGNAAEFLSIDEDTGDIRVSADDVFDYHRQNVIFVQVQAVDTLGEPYNTVNAQLVIRLRDINNTPPTLRLPRGSHSTEENVPAGHLITASITATDPDTTALLEFEIDWDSSYATKQGRDTDPREYHECVEIITEYPNEDQKGSAVGRVLVKEIRPGITIDFEMFEVLYLAIRVYDRETLLGDDYDESMFTLTIIDLNDNPPVWDEGTLEQAFSVRERSASGVVIGSVLATDIDGPLYNQVRYTIFPRNGTPEGLVTIHFYTGQITVDTAQAIDADEPPRWSLYYTIIASDRCYAEDPDDCPPDPTYHDVDGEITIDIMDVNNKEPLPDWDDERFNSTVYLLENATHLDFVSYVIATDLDRDELYHMPAYQINYAVNHRLLQFFAVELETGEIYVNYPEGSTEVLDRDRGEDTHLIFFNIFDNFYRGGDGFRHQNDDVSLTVVLLDVNDNAPELPDPNTISWDVSENAAAGTVLTPILHAPDIDQPNHVNSLVGFEIRPLTAVDRDLPAVPVLLNIRSVDTDKGEFYAAMDLRGYWGTYEMPIWAFDHGHPQQDSEETYTLTVRPWNYNAPVFVYPAHDAVIRLAREPALLSQTLQITNGDLLPRAFASDEDGGSAGQVSFRVAGNDAALEYFDISSDGDNFGTLSLRRGDLTEMITEFTITLEATDGGTEPGPLSSQITFQAVFIPTTGSPIFSITAFPVAFIELAEGLEERHELPHATDLKNHLCLNNCHQIVYTIIGGNTEGHFGLDPATNELFLERELDRSVDEVHTLSIVASNSAENVIPAEGSVLTVTVTVREANPRPIFTQQLYTAGISVQDNINRELLTVQAPHTDGLSVAYRIDETSMVVDPTLEAVQDVAFTLDPTTGVLILNIQPTLTMRGMFEFTVVATDPVGGTDTASVKIYLISNANRVIFRFVNTLENVIENQNFIAQTFSSGFNMICNIDSVVPYSDALGIADTNLTEVHSHFIREDIPVPVEEIEILRSDTVLLREIQMILSTEMLILDDFYTNLSPATGADGNQVTIYVLAALAALLALLCVLLLITFIIRTRTLNRRLEALSMTKYGSVDSGLNRAGLAAPGTNKHAVEGSNPIWNEALKAPDFDTISDASYDSDLIGIEDLPQFRNDFFPPEDASSMEGIMPRNQGHVATHGNKFNFNATPFNPEFANSQFRKP